MDANNMTEMSCVDTNNNAKAIELYYKCFDDEKQFVDYFFKRVERLGETHYMFKEEKLASMFFTFNKNSKYFGKDVKYDLLVGAGTDFEFRKQGCFSLLINQYLSQFSMQGKLAFVVLMPSISPNFYERFGFCEIECLKNHAIQIDELKQQYELLKIGVDIEVNLATMICEKLYSQYVKKNKCRIVETKKHIDFIEKINEVNAYNGEMYILQDKAKYIGYVVFENEPNTKMQAATDILIVSKTVRLMKNIAEDKNGFMVRIVDARFMLKRFFNCLSKNDRTKVSAGCVSPIKVFDEACRKNNFHFVVKENKLLFFTNKPKHEDVETKQVSIGELSKLCFTGKSETILGSERLESPNPLFIDEY